jgi:UDP-N-acetylglucosamine acyltransferase
MEINMIHPNCYRQSRCGYRRRREIGAYSIIGEDVTIGKGTWIGPHVVVDPHVTIGPDVEYFNMRPLVPFHRT